jgi:hypothetical protein
MGRVETALVLCAIPVLGPVVKDNIPGIGETTEALRHRESQKARKPEDEQTKCMVDGLTIPQQK